MLELVVIVSMSFVDPVLKFLLILCLKSVDLFRRKLFLPVSIEIIDIPVDLILNGCKGLK
jgi:hypothetical protein